MGAKFRSIGGRATAFCGEGMTTARRRLRQTSFLFGKIMLLWRAQVINGIKEMASASTLAATKTADTKRVGVALGKPAGESRAWWDKCTGRVIRATVFTATGEPAAPRATARALRFTVRRRVGPRATREGRTTNRASVGGCAGIKIPKRNIIDMEPIQAASAMRSMEVVVVAFRGTKGSARKCR